MSPKIKKFLAVVIGIFALAMLTLAILTIWDIITIDVAKDAFVRTAYSLGAILGVALVLSLISKLTD